MIFIHIFTYLWKIVIFHPVFYGFWGDFQWFSAKMRTLISKENCNSSSKNRPIDLKIGTNDPCNSCDNLTEADFWYLILFSFYGNSTAKFRPFLATKQPYRAVKLQKFKKIKNCFSQVLETTLRSNIPIFSSIGPFLAD